MQSGKSATWYYLRNLIMKNLTSKIQWRSGVIALSTLVLLSMASSSTLAGAARTWGLPGPLTTAATAAPGAPTLAADTPADCRNECAVSDAPVFVDGVCMCVPT